MPPADYKRLRTIIVSFPLVVVTSVILYKRLVLGEEQRKLPRPAPDGSVEIIKDGTRHVEQPAKLRDVLGSLVKKE